jgi:putative acetyltransferase
MTDPALRIAIPNTPADLDAVRDLMRAFVGWHRTRHAADRHLVDAYFDDDAFERELAELPVRYAAPDGALLLARLDGAPVGCVALRRLDGGRCELKRMFVRPEARRRGVGRALARGVLDLAAGSGYRAVLLDTSVRQGEALALYRSLGFADVPPYYPVPAPLADWLVFLRLELPA